MAPEVHMTSMHCFFVVESRAVGPHTPEEDNTFLDADVRFRAGLLSVLSDTIVDAYVPLLSGKKCGMHLSNAMEFLMLALSCMSWSSVIIIEWSMTAR
jgi:hypothetical protein